MARPGKVVRSADRTTILDALHLAAILICSVWTARLIVEEHFGSIKRAAFYLTDRTPPIQGNGSITIRLDERTRTAAR